MSKSFHVHGLDFVLFKSFNNVTQAFSKNFADPKFLQKKSFGKGVDGPSKLLTLGR